MGFRGLTWLGIGLAILLSLQSGTTAEQSELVRAKRQQAGFLHRGSPEKRTLCEVPYLPQPGDILLYDCMIPLNHFAYSLAGTGAPTHSAIAIEAADHHTVLLELIGDNVFTMKVELTEVDERLRSYSGKIMMRRLRQPLSAEQSAALTDFAVAQKGKGFATFRCFLHLTPFRARVGLRRYLFGHTYLCRDRWICSELVVAAATAAGILDPDTYPANAIYPRDLAYDEFADLSAIYEPPVEWSPEPISDLQSPIDLRVIKQP
jgi:hypothetical protein